MLLLAEMVLPMQLIRLTLFFAAEVFRNPTQDMKIEEPSSDLLSLNKQLVLFALKLSSSDDDDKMAVIRPLIT